MVMGQLGTRPTRLVNRSTPVIAIKFMEKIISSAKKQFSEAGKILKDKIPNLETVFCIGSAAKNNTFKNQFFQDFDIHFYVNKNYLDKDDLDAVKGVFKKIAENLETDDIAVDFCIKDKPWKMIPRKKINVGFHGTLLNKLDFEKRIGPNYILALNMFKNAEILFGKLDYPTRSIVSEDFLTQAGGVGWLKENFYRIINSIDPSQEAMIAPIKEIAVYFGLTPLIHYYYLRNKRTANREESRVFFLNQTSIPLKIKESVEFIYCVKNSNKPYQLKNNKPLLEVSYDILNYIEQLFSRENTGKINTKSITIDEDSRIVSAILERPVTINSTKIFVQAGNFEQVLASIKQESATFVNVTPDEYFESLKFIIHNPRVDKLNRIYFFDRKSPRASYTVDFSMATFESLAYSWEKGIATFVQRLNENYLNSQQLVEDDVILAEILTFIGYKNYYVLKQKDFSQKQLEAELVPKKGSSQKDRYFHYLKYLSDLGKLVSKEVKD
jgi:hypothetical protein